MSDSNIQIDEKIVECLKRISKREKRVMRIWLNGLRAR